MEPVAHPEVLARDWVPPVPLGRESAVAEIVRRLDPPRPVAPPPWVVGVAGPRGAGTSAVARRAAREVGDRLRAAGGPPGRQVAIRLGGQRGTHGVASALLQRFDEGFDGRGFPTAEILAGFLRRVRREGRPLVLLMDDLRVGGPDIAPVLRAVADPDRFLPEGEFGLPAMFVEVAGTEEGLATLGRTLGDRYPWRPWVVLAPYDGRSLAAIVRDRAQRALGHAAPEALVTRAVEAALRDGGGAVRSLEQLRRECAGSTPVPGRTRLRDPAVGAVEVELRVVRAIEEAAASRDAPVGEVRRREAALAEAQGFRPLPATTLWRRIVRLEAAGYVRREIRPGGVGGTRSVLRILTPVDEWVTSSLRPGNRPGVAGYADAGWVPTEPPSPPLSARPSVDPTD